MDRLTLDDNALARAIRPDRPMHTIVVCVCAGPPPAIEEVTALVAARVAHAPRFRQVIATVPFGLAPAVWVDDEQFDIRQHVRHSALPRPGDRARLVALCEVLAAQSLDTTRPLWELWLVEGLSSGRFALISKTHPLLVDGTESPDITDKLLTRDSRERFGTMPPWRPRARPSLARLMLDGLTDYGPPARAKALVGAFAAHASEAVRPDAAGASALAAKPASRERRVAWLTLPLADLRRIRAARGATVQSVLIAAIGAGVSEWMARHRDDPVPPMLQLLVPLSSMLRREHGALGSRITPVRVTLPVRTPDPSRHLASVARTIDHGLAGLAPPPAQEIAAIGTFAVPTLLASSARLLWATRDFDLAFVNVPGPGRPRYFCGRRVLDVRPLMPLPPARGIGICAASYCEHLTIGITVDPKSIPDLDVLADSLESAFKIMIPGSSRRRDAA